MHIIIVGAGEVGSYLAEILTDERQDVCVIEQDEHRVRLLDERLDARVLQGTGMSRDLLARAGIDRADLLLAVTQTDEVNLVVAMTADRMHPECRTVARVRDRRFLHGRDTLTAAEYGVDLLLGPEEAVANHVVHLLEYEGPGQIRSVADGKVVLLELPIQPHSALPYATLEELSADLPTTALFVGVLGDTGMRIATPDDRPLVGERLLVLCAPGQVHDVLEMVGSDLHHVKRVLLIGAGNVGLQVAHALQKMKFDVTVVERDRARAHEVATGLNASVVLHGDGTDPSALAERMGDGFDAVVVLVDHDADSLLAGMVAKQQGAKKVIARVDNHDYAPIARQFGIDALISPRRAVANAILRFVRRSHISSTIMLGDHQGELIDFRIDSKSNPSLLEKPVGELKVPDDCLIGVISRGGEILVPARNSAERIQPGDHVFVVALRQAVPKIEEMFG